LSKDRKDHTEIELDPIGYSSARNAENRTKLKTIVRSLSNNKRLCLLYGPPWAHYLGGYQDRLLGGPLGLPGLRYTAPKGVEHKDYTGVVLG
jgi:hypothetical protein